MSSEKRSISPCAFESEVPPLKTRDFPNGDFWKRSLRTRQTQKSFSMIVGLIPSLDAASEKMSRRSPAGSRASLSIRIFFRDFLDRRVHPTCSSLSVQEYPLVEGRGKPPADLRNDLRCNAIFAVGFQRLDDKAALWKFESRLLQGGVLEGEGCFSHSIR